MFARDVVVTKPRVQPLSVAFRMGATTPSRAADHARPSRPAETAAAVSGAAGAFHIHILDGLAHRLGWSIKLGGGALRRVEAGVVGSSAFSIVAGVLLIMAIYGGYAAGWLHR